MRGQCVATVALKGNLLSFYTRVYACYWTMSLLKRSDYFISLNPEAKKRCESKVTSTGLNLDPYVIEDEKWTICEERFHTIKVNNVHGDALPAFLKCRLT